LYVDGKVDEADIASRIMGQASRVWTSRIIAGELREPAPHAKSPKISPMGVRNENVTYTFEVRVSSTTPQTRVEGADGTANVRSLDEHKGRAERYRIGGRVERC